MNTKISKAKTVGIQIDSRSNIRNDGIINILVITPEPVLYKTVESKDNKHDAQYMCDILVNVIEEIGASKVLSIVTDNASNMKATWNLINRSM